MFREYGLKIKKILADKENYYNWESILENHEEMIRTIQHERIIHLMVTIFVGIVMSMSCFLTILTKEFYMIYLDFPLMFLFFGYLIHYRFLENTTQEWYKIRRMIKKRL